MIKQFTHGRTIDDEGSERAGPPTSHTIQDGWKKQGTDRNGRPCSFPTALPGFIICRDSRDKDGRKQMCLGLMQKLGPYTLDTVKKAIEGGNKAESGLLPDQVSFALMATARQGKNGWEFPNLFDSSFIKWTTAEGKASPVPFCRGDGECASRLVEGGTRKEIECVPVGTPGVSPDQFCRFSADKSCKPRGWLILMLLHRDKATGQLLALEPTANARFKVTTQSVQTMMQWHRALIDLADRLDGDIFGITGVLSVNMKECRQESGEKGIAPKMMIAFDEAAIWQKLRSKAPRLEGPQRAEPAGLGAPVGREGDKPEPAKSFKAAMEEEIPLDAVFGEPTSLSDEDAVTVTLEEPVATAGASATSDGGGTGESAPGILTRILRTNKKPAKQEGQFQYGVMIEGDKWFNWWAADNSKRFALAEAAKKSGKQVIIRTETKGNFTNLVSIENPPPAAPPKTEPAAPKKEWPAVDPEDAKDAVELDLEAVMGTLFAGIKMISGPDGDDNATLEMLTEKKGFTVDALKGGIETPETRERAEKYVRETLAPRVSAVVRELVKQREAEKVVEEPATVAAAANQQKSEVPF